VAALPTAWSPPVWSLTVPVGIATLLRGSLEKWDLLNVAVPTNARILKTKAISESALG
jgi:hypothetical protein